MKDLQTVFSTNNVKTLRLLQNTNHPTHSNAD